MTVVIESSALKPESFTGKVHRVRVIEGDRQGSSAYYPKEVLEAGAHLFKAGTKIYGDHPSLTEREDRPERSFRDIIGWFVEDAEYKGKDLFANIHIIEAERARIRELAEAGVIGLSIRAEGEMDEASGQRVLKKFTNVLSVDVVTEAGAGGKFVRVLESKGSKKTASESVADPDKKEIAMEIPKEFLEALDALRDELKATTSALAEANKLPPAKKDDGDPEDKKDGGKDEDKEDAKGKKIKPAKESLSFAELDELLTEAELTAAGRKAVIEKYEAGAPDMAPVIESEKARETEIRESVKVPFRGNGGDRTELTESKTFSLTGKAA